MVLSLLLCLAMSSLYIAQEVAMYANCFAEFCKIGGGIV